MKIKFTQKGYTLVEAIVYVSILAIFFITIVNSLLAFSKPYRELTMLRIIERSGLESMEKISREIRGATSVDIVNSTLGTSPGVLTLISTAGGVSTTTKFYVDNGILKLDVNGTYYGPLTNATTTVTSLVFYRMTNTNSTAVKYDMTLEMTIGSTTKSKSYHSTVILKSISS